MMRYFSSDFSLKIAISGIEKRGHIYNGKEKEVYEKESTGNKEVLILIVMIVLLLMLLLMAKYIQ